MITSTASRAAASNRACSSYSRLTAIDGRSFRAPSVAAATVPEYKTLTPTFSPPLMPLTTRSGWGQNLARASFTQSAGLPSTAQPIRGSPFRTPERLAWLSKTSLAISGVRKVMLCPTPLCSIAGATTHTSPSRSRA